MRSKRFAQRSSAAGVDALIVHARKAWLEGLSPRENRDVPPLDYDRVFRLKAAHPRSADRAQWRHRQRRAGRATPVDRVDGVMMGRAAYQEPWRLLAVDPLMFGAAAPFALAQGGRAGAHALYRARACARHAAACHHPPLLGLFRARAGRARVPPASRDRRGQARRRARGSARGAGAGDGHAARRMRAHRRGLMFPVIPGPCWRRLARRARAAGRGRRGRRRRHRHSRRPVRHRRRRHHRAGALRGFPHARRAGRRAHAALRRHLDGDHRADHHPLLSGAPRARARC